MGKDEKKEKGKESAPADFDGQKFLGDPVRDPAHAWRHKFGQKPSIELPDSFPLAGSDRSMYSLGEPENGFVVWTIISTEEIKSKELYLKELEFMINTPEYERFRFEVKTVKGNPTWIRKKDFKIEDACTFHSLKKAGDKNEFQQFLQEKIETTRLREGLLWRTFIVDNYSNDPKCHYPGGVVCFGVHHAITDGIGLMRLCLVSTMGSDGDLTALFPFLKPGGAEDKAPAGASSPAAKPAAANGEKTVPETVTPAPAPAPAQAPRKKRSAFAKYKGLAAIGLKMGWGVHDTFYKNLVLKDRAGALKGKRPFKQHALAWGRPIPIAELRTTSRALGTTLNALVTSMGVGAMRRYLAARDDLHGRKYLLATGPFPLVRKVNIGAEGQATGGEANGMGVVLNKFPIAESNRVKRARDIKATVDSMKFSPEAWLTYLAMKHTGNIPKAMRNVATNSIGKRVTCGFSNIPGPGKPVYFCGLKFTDIFFCAPCWFKTGMGASWTICSYNGMLTPAVMTNREIAPDPQELIWYMEEEWREYKLLAEAYNKM